MNIPLDILPRPWYSRHMDTTTGPGAVGAAPEALTPTRTPEAQIMATKHATTVNTVQDARTAVTCPHCGHITRSPRWSNLTLTAYCAAPRCHRKMPLVDAPQGA